MIHAREGKSKIEAEYEKLAGKRTSFLSRGQDYSKMTLPYILPEVSPSASAQNKHGFQGIGAEAVNHLANKVTSTLFPVAEPFFSMALDPDVEKELMDKGEFDKGKMTKYFNQLADLAMRQMIKLRMRPQLVNYQKHLIISGNSCLVFTDRGVKQLGLDKYVAQRDPQGNLLKAITHEKIDFTELPPSIQAIILAQKPNQKREDMKDNNLYTSYCLQPNGEWMITQAVDSLDVMEPKLVSTNKLPIIIGRWNATSGEDYGRGLVEDHSGDFYVLEFLSEARARGAATMMDVKYLVRPGSLTDVETMNKAPVGEFVAGMEDDISVLQLDKFADHTFIKDVMEEYSQRIGRNFLLLQTQVRDSERTTKYEIQRVANELDMAMGGNYSSQSDELQQPVSLQLLDMIDPRLVDDSFVPIILTGLEALGRARELEKIMQYTEMMALPEGWPEELRGRMKWVEYSDTISANLSLETNWLTTEEEQAEVVDKGVAGEEQSALGSAIASGAGNALGKKIIEG